MRNKQGRYIKGHTPHNLGVKKATSPKCAETYFTPDNFGEKHGSWRGGVQHMTKDCAYLWTGANKRARRPRVIWEQTHGKIPFGMCIWHTDGDKNNDNINNLEVVTRAQMMRRNSNN